MQINDPKFTILLSTAVSLFLVTAIIIILLLASRQRIKQQIALSQTQLHYEQELRTVEQEVQEAVMNHIAQELHDNIGQLLTLMRVQMEQGKKKHPEAQAVLSPINDTLTTTIKQIRALSNTLNSDYIERNGLREAVLQEVSRLQQLEHIVVQCSCGDTEPDLSKDQCLMAFRIFQEMLNNTLKHAQAQNIFIALEGSGNFQLSVRDDGIGFDVAQMMQAANGNGLKNMQKRAMLAGLRFSVESAVGNGSTYRIHQPVPEVL